MGVCGGGRECDDAGAEARGGGDVGCCACTMQYIREVGAEGGVGAECGAGVCFMANPQPHLPRPARPRIRETNTRPRPPPPPHQLLHYPHIPLYPTRIPRPSPRSLTLPQTRFSEPAIGRLTPSDVECQRRCVPG